MAKRLGLILVLLFIMAVSANLLAQQKAKTNGAGKPAENKPAQPQMVMVPVYLGDSNYQGGTIQKNTFNNLIKQGLTSHDSQGHPYKITEFDLIYSERNIYEDEIGNVMPVIDLSTVHGVGNMLPESATSGGKVSPSGEISLSIYDRVKPGDTLFFDHIRVLKENAPNAGKLVGKPMKFTIVR